MWQPNRKPTSLPRLLVLLFGTSFLLIGGILFLADIKCHYDIENWWAVPYPGAETVALEYDLFRPRALGETRWTLHSHDDEETVRAFYRERTLEILDSRRSRGLAYTDRFIQSVTAPDGSRLTQIVLYSACGT